MLGKLIHACWYVEERQALTFFECACGNQLDVLGKPDGVKTSTIAKRAERHVCDAVGHIYGGEIGIVGKRITSNPFHTLRNTIALPACTSRVTIQSALVLAEQHAADRAHTWVVIIHLNAFQTGAADEWVFAVFIEGIVLYVGHGLGNLHLGKSLAAVKRQPL